MDQLCLLNQLLLFNDWLLYSFLKIFIFLRALSLVLEFILFYFVFVFLFLLGLFTLFFPVLVLALFAFLSFCFLLTLLNWWVGWWWIRKRHIFNLLKLYLFLLYRLLVYDYYFSRNFLSALFLYFYLEFHVSIKPNLPIIRQRKYIFNTFLQGSYFLHPFIDILQVHELLTFFKGFQFDLYIL